MFRNIGVAGSTSPTNNLSSGPKVKDVVLTQSTELYGTKLWKPTALRAPVLILTIAICWSLIGVLEYLLWKSQRDSGLIFAPIISELPLGHTFLYLYFPTVLAVLFSIYWAWIDLETKRLEPYYQLSKANGALGKDSLLLHYPFSFIPLVPLRAFKDRHWPVFWASFAVVLVTWGLVPTQAGLFSVRTVTRTSDMMFSVSTAFMPFEEQATGLSFRFAQSTYGIVALNETLPPYMTHSYALAPFEPRDSQDGVLGQGTYTGPTTMYTLDLACEDVSHKANGTKHIQYYSKNGCTFPLGLDGNLTFGEQITPGSSVLDIKNYTGQYVGYHNGGLSDYYLSSDCPKSENSTFFASLAKSKAKVEDPLQDVTAIFCRTRYWRQEVSATVDRLTKLPLAIEPLTDKQTLEWDVFNTTNFESALNSVSLGIEVRGDNLPTVYMPRYWDMIANTDLSLTSGKGAVTMPMVGLALAAGSRRLEDYLDWRHLSQAYTEAYQTLFARAMVDVLSTNLVGSNFTSLKEAIGQQQLTTEAVRLEPLFVHIVVGFLGVVSLATVALLVLSFIRTRNLRTDPSTIASIMSLVADNEPLLSDFADLDCCTMDDVHKIIGQKRYKLVNDETGACLVQLAHDDVINTEHLSPILAGQRRDSPSSIAKPVRPLEFSMWIALPFINLFVALAIVLGIIYGKARINGLPLPSSNSIVQNILENYIPTAIATLIEPMWILINRLLCMLQPLEELQKCNAKPDRSIDTDYNSLPPQLVVFQALRSKHFVLAAVCTMALLANVLAVAFAGLFNQKMIDVHYTMTFQPPYQFKFVPINGSIGPQDGSTFGSGNPSGAYRGGDGQDQFLIAESNYTRNTSLPAWTDETMFYMPLFLAANNETQSQFNHFEGRTKAFGAVLDCEELKRDGNFRVDIKNSASLEGSLNITISGGSGNVGCTDSFGIGQRPLGSSTTCVSGPSSLEFVNTLNARANATREERDVCAGSIVLGWMRGAETLCPGGRNLTLSEENSLFVHCRPRLRTGSARIRFDQRGKLQRSAEDVLLDQETALESHSLFSNDPINLIGQSNRYLFPSSFSLHNDSFATDMFSHIVSRAANGKGLADPNKPLPTFEDIRGPVGEAYSKLFAIWLGNYKENLLLPATNDQGETTTGYRVEPEQRLFLSTTMFIISEAILCTYVLVAIWVYIRRPGQYLARLPTSIAAVIALFAASTVVQDLRGTSHLDRQGRARHLSALDYRYGFGSFVGGGDGRVHIGIEKTPLVVKPRTKSTWLGQKVPLLRKASGGLV